MFRLPSSRLLRSAQLHVDSAKLSSNTLRLAPSILANTTSRCFATVHTGKALPDVWFTGTRLCADGSTFNTSNKKPDERTVKLGKSKFAHLPLQRYQDLHLISSSSSPDSTRTITNTFAISTSPGDLEPTNNAPPVSLDTSTPADCLGSRGVFCCIMDLSYCVGPTPSRWKR